MKGSYRYALLTVIITSFVLRSIPFFRYVHWGIDYGEYVYYTGQWVSGGTMYLGIDGWAQAYPFFPGMFILGGSVHFSGVHLFEAVQLPTLIVSTMVPILVFLMAHQLTRDARISLLSAIFLTVLAPFVYNFSQPKPETLGFFLMLLILLLLLKTAEHGSRSLLLLVPASIALVVTHHFSSYFLILFVLGGLFMSVTLRRSISRADVLRIGYFLFFTTAAFMYWFFAAPVFREERLTDALGLPSYAILLVPYMAVLSLAVIRRIRERTGLRPRIALHNEDMSRFLLMSFLLMLIIFAFILNLYFHPIPGRDIELGALGFYYLPVAFLGMFTLAASKMIWAYRDGLHLLGWMSFAILSFFAGVFTGSSSLLPMRQMAFLMLPGALLFGIGLIRFNYLANPFKDKRRTAVISVVVILLLAWNLPLIYPTQDMAQGYIEGTEGDEIEGCFWARTNLEGKLAAEHRLSAAAFAVGYMNLTWVDGDAIYFSDHPHEALAEAREMGVRYIIWDHKTIKGVTTTDGAHPHPFNPVLLEYYRGNYLLYMGDQTEIYIVP